MPMSDPSTFSMSPNQATLAEKSIRFSSLAAAQPLNILSRPETLNASGSRRACRMAISRNASSLPDHHGRLTMATADKSSAALTDLEYAIQLIMTGKKDPEFTARVQAETEKITEEIRSKHGVLNIAVDLSAKPAMKQELRAGQQHLAEVGPDRGRFGQGTATSKCVSEPDSRTARSRRVPRRGCPRACEGGAAGSDSPGGRGQAVNERPFDAAAVPSLSALAQESARHCLPGSYRRVRLPLCGVSRAGGM